MSVLQKASLPYIFYGHEEHQKVTLWALVYEQGFQTEEVDNAYSVIHDDLWTHKVAWGRYVPDDNVVTFSTFQFLSASQESRIVRELESRWPTAKILDCR